DDADDDVDDVFGGGHALVLRARPATRLLDLAVLALALDAPLLRRTRRFRREASRVDVQPFGDLRTQTLGRELAVLVLRAALRGCRTHRWPEPLEQAGALAGSERRRALDVEAHCDLGVGGIGVLAAGTARGREAPLQLVERDRTAPADPQDRP